MGFFSRPKAEGAGLNGVSARGAAAPTAATAPQVAFFAPDVCDVSTIKRVEMFAANGLRFVVFAFRRRRYNSDYRPAWPGVDLGRTEDRHYWRRAVTLLGAAFRLFRARQWLRESAVLYARNIDQLALALLARAIVGRPLPVVYEVLDVAPAFTAAGPAGWLLRAFERRCLRSVSLLVVSSPGFMANFYAPLQGYCGPWFLLENKLSLPPPAAPAPPARSGGDYRWRVGCFGLIRGNETFALIARLAARLPDVQFVFRGVLTTVDRQRFEAALAVQPNLVHGGEYRNPDDLARIYSEVDLVWALDLEHAEHNSRWLMPCRYYEGGIFGVPCLAAAGFEIGRHVERLGVGWTFAAPYEATLVSFFRTLTAEEHAAKRQRLLDLPATAFVAGDETADLCRRLAALARGTGVHVVADAAPA